MPVTPQNDGTSSGAELRSVASEMHTVNVRVHLAKDRKSTGRSDRKRPLGKGKGVHLAVRAGGGPPTEEFGDHDAERC